MSALVAQIGCGASSKVGDQRADEILNDRECLGTEDGAPKEGAGEEDKEDDDLNKDGGAEEEGDIDSTLGALNETEDERDAGKEEKEREKG